MTRTIEAGALTPDEAVKVLDHLTFANFVAHRDRGASAELYAKYITIDLDDFERRYQALRAKRDNAGARQADDVRCTICGSRDCGCSAQYQAEQRESYR